MAQELRSERILNNISHHSISDIISAYVDEYQYDLTRLCMSLCKNNSDADDLFQETWLKAIRFYSQYDSSQKFDKWLFAICVNTFKDNSRRHHIKNRAVFSTTEEEDAFIAGIKDKSAINEDYIALTHIVEDLPEKYKMIITLHYFKDYSISDVAEILQVPVSTAKSRLKKAKELIQRGWNK